MADDMNTRIPKLKRCSFCGKTSEQVRRLVAGPNVHICDECIMGIAAAVAFQAEVGVDENAKRMDEAAQRVRTATVTYAVRDSEMEDLHIKQGDIIGLYNGKIAVDGQNIHDVTFDLMKQIVTDDDELITVYYGKEVAQADAKALTDEIASEFDNCDVEIHMGGQPLYYYLISVE